MSNVPPPPGGLGSNSNYTIFSGCIPITHLKVVVEVETDIIANIGFGLQLNCLSQVNPNIAWQQYGFSLQTANGLPPNPSPGTLSAFVNNWNYAINDSVVYWWPNLIQISDSKIAAKSKLQISLHQNAGNQINEVVFVYYEPDGTPHELALPLPSPGDPTGDLAPIVAFQVNLVGKFNALQTYFLSGSGTITCTAHQTLYVLNAPPPCGEEPVITLETGNTVYGELPSGWQSRVVQSFSIAPVPHFTPGGPFAVSQLFDENVTSVFAVDRNGQLAMFSAQGGASWQAVGAYGPQGLARQGAAVAACKDLVVANQTDVFVIDQYGQLEFFWIDGPTGTVNGPQIIQQQPNGIAPADAFLAAASQQSGTNNRTDVALVDNTGALAVFSANELGFWSGPAILTDPGFASPGQMLAVSQDFGALNRTDAFLVNSNYQLVVFSVDGQGSWQGPANIGAPFQAPAGSYLAASQRFGLDRTDVFLIDMTGQLVAFYHDATGAWTGLEVIAPQGFFIPGGPVAVCQNSADPNQTDVFIVDEFSRLYVFWSTSGGAWHGPVQVGPTAFAEDMMFIAASPQFGGVGQTDVFVIAQNGMPSACWSGNVQTWNGPIPLL